MSQPKDWIRFSPDRFLRGTDALPNYILGAYARLFCHYIISGGPVHDDDETLRTVCRCTVQEWDRVRAVLARMFRVKDGMWRSEKLDAELRENEAADVSNTMRTLAARIANPRHQSDADHVPLTLDDGSIPTYDDVQAHAELVGCPPETTKRFYEHHESNQLWLNKHGRLINWQYALQIWRDRARCVQPGRPTSGAEMIVRKTELDRVEKKLADMRASLGAYQSFSDHDKKEYVRLKTRKAELMQILGMAI